MKSIGSRLRLFLKDERGGVLILVAVVMVVLLGMTALAVDVGLLYSARRQMVNAADSAALAGAQELIIGGDAVDVARHYAISENHADDAQAFLGYYNGSADYNTVTVNTVKTVDYLFARALSLGGDNSDVTATATALIAPIVEKGGLIPIGLREVVYLEAASGGNIGLIEFHNIGPGNWGVLSFEGHGTGQTPFPIANYITNGYPGVVRLADPDVYTASGAAGAGAQPFVEDALTGRIGDEVYVPIVRGEVSGSQWIEVVGFASVIIRSVTVNGSDIFVSGEFIRTIAVGPIDPNAPSFGLEGVTLIE